MPYIGNNHVVGDHTSNFKVLDDISSHTATFDGSASAVVSTSDETIRIVNHRFVQGQRVTYNNGGGGNIGGLSSGTAYYVIFNTTHTIKLATSLTNANNLNAINLSSVGSGTSHTLTVAFDGTNTKFKITHSNGSSPRISDATQLQIAINNVVQRPNKNDASFTEGYAVANRNILFKTAPASDHIFWGSLIGEAHETFDIADNKVDTFTADGTSTNYTLSKNPPSKNDLDVTLDGVTQHISAFSLNGNVITFTAAPANGISIQVKHIGFAGASTSGVTGFYGRAGNVALTANDHITTGDITSRNINASGIVTAVSFVGDGTGLTGVANTDFVVGTAITMGTANFTGNVTIGGTLTYEDVTNIDSVGIITARDGIVVSDATESNSPTTGSVKLSGGLGVVKNIYTSGGAYVQGSAGLNVSHSTDINGDLDVDGHTNLDNVSIAGVTTITSSTFPLNVHADTNYQGILVNGTNAPTVSFAKGTDTTPVWKVGLSGSDPDNLAFGKGAGNSNLFRLLGAGGASLLGTLTAEHLGIDGYLYHNGDGNTKLLFGTDTIDLQTGGSTRIRAENSGVAITGVSTFTGAIDANGDLDVDGHTNLDNVSIAGVTTFSANVNIAGILTATTSTQRTSKFYGVTTTERNALSASEGDIIYNTTTDKHEFYTSSSSWAAISATAPEFSNASGSLGTIYGESRGGYTITNPTATGDAPITYSITAGSLPSNMSINSSTGAISGTPSAVGSDTTSTFTVRASNAGGAVTRQYSILVKTSITENYSYTGSTVTWSKPNANVRNVVFRMWGGAGTHGTCTSNGQHPGAGGKTEGIINVTNHSSLYLQVGEAGKDTGTGSGGWPNGGSGNIQHSCKGAGGGGSTNIYHSSGTGSYTYIVAVAGGGGGVSHGNPNSNGGDGGGTNGSNSNRGGGGGTQNAGGSQGSTPCGNTGGNGTGTRLQGGSAGGGSGCTNSGAGGGGGWWGGGAGGNSNSGNTYGGGGGGSGYFDTSLVSSGATKSYGESGWSGDKPSGIADRASYGDNNRGGHGYITLVY